MSNSNTMENENDPVIKEIPVFLSKSLADKLFIFQYPVRPAREGYDNATIIKSSIKPENQEVVMEVAIDTQSVNYDHSKGEQIAINADGDSKTDQEDEENAFDRGKRNRSLAPPNRLEERDRNKLRQPTDKSRISWKGLGGASGIVGSATPFQLPIVNGVYILYYTLNLMDKTVLQSFRALPNCSNYAVGIFQDGELHVTPLKGVIQMRPQFNYLDKSDKRVREEAKNMGEEVDEEEEGPKQVSVTFARQKPEFMKKMQEQSFQHHAQKSLEERWIHTNYIPANGTQAELARLEMFCSATDETVNTLNLSTQQYLDQLAPRMKDDQLKLDISDCTMSLNYIRTLPLLDQIKTLMKDAKVISFTQLRSILSPDQETSAILKYLQQVAVLVQGNWVVSSELLYPKDSISSQNGISAELMCRARDYVLLSFTEHEFLNRKTISSVIKLPPDEIKEIFTNLGVNQPKKGWHFVIPPTKEFTERYPEIAQRQEMFWEAKRKHLRDAMEVQNHIPQRQRRKSNRESVGSENEEKNVGRGRKTLRDSSMSDNDSATEPVKHKKTVRARKVSETT